ncbi:retrotransposon protein [Cucumis melo var. makuwa]|uniref:Retrotransposon protein n=1 Tax=Cucumis melo var. makuwa TaxID=1194695 RepID=A0A5D3C944_CUCMM|nr:retrotransposon protein [Cucumis melo var. makuwa]TYK08371.1 retrotransposon protein [Cucumis melo var. makuwa]
MYNQGLDMSPDDIMATRPNRIGKGRTDSTGLKRTQGGQSIETGIPELSKFDRARCMCLLMRNVDNMKTFLDVPDDMELDY